MPRLGEIMTVEELAYYLHVSPSTIYRLMEKRTLPGFKIGDTWRFNRSQIDAWRRAQDRKPRP